MQMPAIAAERTDLSPEDIEHLQLLLADWTLIADLSFADLLLWLPTFSDAGFIAAGQIRPTTSRTHIPEDLVGHFVPRARHPELDRAYATGEVSDGLPTPKHSVTQAIPIRRNGKVIALLGRYSNGREVGRLEEVYEECANDLVYMLETEEFPRATNNDQGTGGRGGAPRVGDGLMLLDAKGVIVYATPNARSAFRRLGLSSDVEGQVLAEIVAKLNRQGTPVNDTLSLVARGRIQATSEVASQQAAATLRSIPLNGPQHVQRTLMLVRDVSDLRRREQALLGKDAAIREIHHRVKNNLQTVASLLRLQGRRLNDDSAKTAIAEAGRRVATIAVVHDLLAHNPGSLVDFDDVVNRVVNLTVETSMNPRVRAQLDGAFGVLPSDKATTLALVVAELVANAVEHGSAADRELELNVSARRTGRELLLTVTDDGNGIALPVDADAGLGLAIVSTLVRDELNGEIQFGHVHPNDEHAGTRVIVRIYETT